MPCSSHYSGWPRGSFNYEAGTASLAPQGNQLFCNMCPLKPVSDAPPPLIRAPFWGGRGPSLRPSQGLVKGNPLPVAPNSKHPTRTLATVSTAHFYSVKYGVLNRLWFGLNYIHYLLSSLPESLGSGVVPQSRPHLLHFLQGIVYICTVCINQHPAAAKQLGKYRHTHTHTLTLKGPPLGVMLLCQRQIETNGLRTQSWRP